MEVQRALFVVGSLREAGINALKKHLPLHYRPHRVLPRLLILSLLASHEVVGRRSLQLTLLSIPSLVQLMHHMGCPHAMKAPGSSSARNTRPFVQQSLPAAPAAGEEEKKEEG